MSWFEEKIKSCVAYLWLTQSFRTNVQMACLNLKWNHVFFQQQLLKYWGIWYAKTLGLSLDCGIRLIMILVCGSSQSQRFGGKFLATLAKTLRRWVYCYLGCIASVAFWWHQIRVQFAHVTDVVLQVFWYLIVKDTLFWAPLEISPAFWPGSTSYLIISTSSTHRNYYAESWF